jgi:hypothetical protein
LSDGRRNGATEARRRGQGCGAALAAAALVTSGCVKLCENQTLSEHPSPDGRLNVVVFERNCGATTPFVTHVSLLDSDERLDDDDDGNVFRSDTNRGAAPSGPGGGPVVLVRWTDAAHLWLQHHPRARVFVAESRVRGVAVTITPSWSTGP